MAKLYLPVLSMAGEPGRAEPAGWLEAFPFLLETGHVISLVGGGGKTTLMYALARQFAALGKKTLVTTTTHIQRPPKKVRACTVEEARALWRSGTFAVICSDMPTPRADKMAPPEPSLLAACRAEAEAVLIEADGARRLPCKAPSAREPVLLSGCDIVLGVAGMRASGRPLSEVCFRWETACELLGVSGSHPVGAAELASLLMSPDGARKGVGGRAFYAVLNQCDDEARLRTALEAAALAARGGTGCTVLTAFDEAERV